MGTPEFAVPSLMALQKSRHQVLAVVTAPDKPQGRGLKLFPSAVKEYALKNNIPLLQPEKLKDEAFVKCLESYKPDLFVVVAFRMLPETIWNLPPLGTINLHASLLPKYRGAAPINWAIINGEKETGLTTFRLKHEIDTGNILFSEKEPIFDEDDAGSLYERLMIKGADLVVTTVNAIADGSAAEEPQMVNGTTPPPAPKIFKETCELTWTMEVVNCLNKIRGLSPYPGAWCRINNKVFKILKATTGKIKINAEPGTLHSNQKDELEIRCNNGWISILELQPEGKKRMTVSEFFRGNHI